MNILARLFARRRKPTGCAIVVGDGQFQIYVASTPQQRIELELLSGGRNQGSRRMPALLVPQPTSTRGDDSVAVRIGNDTVGYLHHTTGLEFLAALRPSKFDRAACAAMIVVRPDPQLGDTFRLRLDAEVLAAHFRRPSNCQKEMASSNIILRVQANPTNGSQRKATLPRNDGHPPFVEMGA